MQVVTKRQQSGNIYAAHRQWATRPPDECWSDIRNMHKFCQHQKDNSFERDVVMNTRNLAVVEAADDEHDVVLNVSGQDDAHFTNFSFRQFCSSVSAPAEYLSTLPAELVAENLNYGIETQLKDKKTSKLLYYHAPEELTGTPDGKLYTRAVTSKIYDRLWNADITRMLRAIDPSVMAPPRRQVDSPLNRDDGTGTGLYASDHDMFAFMVASQNYIDISGAELVRGFYISNNEVGTGSLNICLFLCDYVCGNHIIWDVKDSILIKARHVGHNASEMFTEVLPYAMALSLSGNMNQEQEHKIKLAQGYMLGKNKKEVVNFMFEKRLTTRKLAEAAYTSAELRHETTRYCDPNSVWGMVCGLTAEAKEIPHYDERVKVEQTATKLLSRVAA